MPLRVPSRLGALVQPRSGLVSGALIRARCRLAARYIRGRSVLDGGCNVADLSDYIPANVDYIGMERSPEIARLARALHPDRQIECVDLEGPWPEAVTGRSFDHVTLLAVLEHLADPGAVLAKARTVLAPGGSIIATTPHPRARRLHAQGARLGLFSRDADEEHERFWGPEDLRALGQAAGLSLWSYHSFQVGLNQLVVWN